MANPAHEPTMDEILASIRRIISDDEQSKPESTAKPARAAGNVSRLFAEPARPDGPAPLKRADSDDIVDLAISNAMEEAKAEVAAAVPKSDVLPKTGTPAAPPLGALPRPLPSREAPRKVASAERRPAEPANDLSVWPEAVGFPVPLASEGRPARSPTEYHYAPAGRVDHRAAPSLLSERADVAAAPALNPLGATRLSSGARTIDGLVEDMLRPMLREWLDEKLPPLVERLVREEIARISPGAG